MNTKPNTQPMEARILAGLDEPMAAGLYELRNGSQLRRMGRALKRYSESVDAMHAATATLYPAGILNLWNLNDHAIGIHYSSGISVNAQLLRNKISRQMPDGREKMWPSGLRGIWRTWGSTPCRPASAWAAAATPIRFWTTGGF